jgi:hypothetical protein
MKKIFTIFENIYQKTLRKHTTMTQFKNISGQISCKKSNGTQVAIYGYNVFRDLMEICIRQAIVTDRAELCAFTKNLNSNLYNTAAF